MGRKTKDIPPEVREIICTLIGAGDSDNSVRKITRIRPEQWTALAARDRDFRELLEKALDQRSGGLASVLRGAMVAQIKRGHPWWAKLAIHNYQTGLRDPDVQSAVRLKRMMERMTAKAANASDLVETDEAVASAAPPPGTIPALVQPEAVPDRAGGPAVGKDGGRKA